MAQRAASGTDRLLGEMERVDRGLARHLRATHPRPFGQERRGSLPPLDYARVQIKAWCEARSGEYDAEVLASTLLAIDTMDRCELAAFLRRLLGRRKAQYRRSVA